MEAVSQDMQPQTVHPFYRWVARVIDLGLWAPIATLVFVPSLLILDSIVGDELRMMEKAPLPSFIITGAVFLTIVMAIDAAIGFRYGNTPGKTLMGITVTESDGSQITFSCRFKRNMGVALYGLGLNVILVSWATMVLQYFIVHIKGVTTYDKKMGFLVSKPIQIGARRGFQAAIVLVLASMLQLYSIKLANEMVNPHGWYIGINAIGEATRSSANQ